MKEGFIRKIKPYEVINESQISEIERCVYQILEKVGLKFEVERNEIFDIFNKGGCKVDVDSRIVRFPKKLVQECLKLCPSKFKVEARNPENNLMIGGDKVYFQPGPGMWYLDLDTYEPRRATRKEFDDATMIYDALPNIHYFHGNCPCTGFEGFDPVIETIGTYTQRTRLSSKVNFIGASVENDRFNIQVADIVGAKGWSGVGAMSPLGWSNDSSEAALRFIKGKFPLAINSGSVWGASAPATISGQLITNIAEDIGPLVLSQLMNPGHEIMVGTFTFPMNMSSGDCFFGNITIGLASCAFVQFWNRFNIPTFVIEAAIPNSKIMDFQSGYEKGMLALSQALAGASVIWLHGTVYGELTAHPIQAILDDDIAGMVGRFLEGVDAGKEALAIDLIEEVGTIPGFYLDKAHTRDWWRKEQYIPKAAELNNIQNWIKGGKKKAVDLAKSRMEEILASHTIKHPLTPSEEADIDRVIKDARVFYKDKMSS